MSSFSINNGVIYKDGQPFFMHLMYVENEDISANYPRLRDYLVARSDNTRFTQMGINTVFTPLSIASSNKANSISLLNELANQGIYCLNEYAGTGDAEFTEYANYEAYAGCLASYFRNETVLNTNGSTSTKNVYCHADDIADPRGRNIATSGYRNSAPVTTAFGPGVGTSPSPVTWNGRTYTHDQNSGHKSMINAGWAKARHKLNWQNIGANKLVLGTGYRWRDQVGSLPIEGAWTEIGSKFAQGNAIYGLNRYWNFSGDTTTVPGIFDITGFQVYGMKLNNSDPNGFGRPYAGMYAFTNAGMGKGSQNFRTVHMAIIGTYQGDWDLPTAPDLRNQIYQAIVGGAKSIAYYSMSTYYTPANCLYGSPPDRRLEIGLFWNEINLKSLALDGITRAGETYMKHILLGKHHLHFATGTGMLTLGEVEGGYSSQPIIVCGSWVLGNSRLIIVVNRDRRSTSTVTNIAIDLKDSTTMQGIGAVSETRDNYNLVYAGLNDKKPTTTTWSLNADKKTLQISTMPPNSVLVLQTTLPGTDDGGGEVVPPSTGFTNRSVVYVTSGNRASANTNAVTDIGNADDNVTWDKKAYTADNRGRPNTWASTTVYSLNDQVKTTANRWYVCETAGTSSGTEPTHTSGTASDGTVTWRYLGTVTTQDFYLCDGIFTDDQIDAVMARSYTPAIRHFRFNQEESGPLLGSSARYGAGYTGQQVSLNTMNSIVGDERFAPSDYGTPIVYWDFGASDLVLNSAGDRATNGDGIATVNPLAGSAVLVQATDTNRPALEINQLNGKSSVGYIGTDNNKMLTTVTRSLIKNINSITLVCVFRCMPEGLVGVNQRLFGHNNNASVIRCTLMIDTGSKVLIGGRSSDSGAEAFTSISSSTVISANTWYIVVGTMDYSTRAGEIFINNTSVATGNICGTAGTVVNTDASSDPIVGRDVGASFDFVGSMACFGIYSGILTQEQRTGLYHRLKRFYNL